MIYCSISSDRAAELEEVFKYRYTGTIAIGLFWLGVDFAEQTIKYLVRKGIRTEEEET